MSEQVGRDAHLGLTNLTHWRNRVLLHAGHPDWTKPPHHHPHRPMKFRKK